MTVHYAIAFDGSELPVIDVTSPEFAPLYDEAEMARRVAIFARADRWRALVPRKLQRLMLSVVARRSRLARAVLHSQGGVVPGMTLYAAKLGPRMLGTAYPTAIDRRLAAAPPAWLSRERLEDMARLVAEGLSPMLAAHPGRPVHLFNIAGGPAADSWNALLVLQKDAPGRLRDRPIGIHVLDLDDEGPAFGARAIEALRGEGGPFRDLDVRFERIAYDWRDAARLQRLLDETHAARGAVAVSSEGGLFEYGSDTEIVSNLEAIRAAGPVDTVVVGSVTRAEGPAEFLREFTVRPRTLAGFRELASRGGFTIDRVIERTLAFHVRLSMRP